ncbi:Ubiquitin-conjugating enzyme like [Melia azedarach]|uniref:Ubiquitin-conjugating enzyme like n=1 Tax=Melia azedarach TaxID=155640 RepID=A0ACC1YSI7_MELAZ|nr:Ubiquitin-conjugating enzyme like [Melia azedarach]
MEPPPVATAQYISQNSRKRVLSGSSSVFMDSEVTEIPPPVFPPPRRRRKPKQVILQEVIDLDKDEDSADVIIIDETVKTRDKGKAIKNNSDGSGSYQPKSSKSFASGSNKLINLNSYHDQHFNFHDDFMDDDYELLQAYFESADIPPGVEAPVPWLANPSLRKEKTVNKNDLVCAETSASSSSLQKGVDVLNHPAEKDLSSSGLNPQSTHSKNSASLTDVGGSAQNPPLHVKSSTQHWDWGKSKSNSKPVASGISANYNYVNHFDPMIFHYGLQPSSWASVTLAPVQNQVGTSNSFYSGMPPLGDPLNYPAPVAPFGPWWQDSAANYPTYPSFYDPFDAAHIPPEEQADTPAASDCTRNKRSVDGDDILRKFELFKQFDAVEDHSDHHYASKPSSMKQPSSKWVKRIQEEWKILENDLPDTIFVRVYESRMDILRAVIIGAEGTPYHDGLFFFDVFFPSGYPNIPPHVHYHSGGLRLNPNLYNCGKVCLSLLNTWNGQKNEKWIPSVSTMLQVLVSIQALILNEKPYFNEPGYASTTGTPHGELQSQMYNESTFLLSLKTMLYTMRRPPKHFNDFVMGHFCKRAHSILTACKAYMDGAQVGSVVKSGVQNFYQGNKNHSQQFKNSLASYIDLLVKEFTQIGAKDCEKFLTQAKGGVLGVGNIHKTAK